MSVIPCSPQERRLHERAVAGVTRCDHRTPATWATLTGTKPETTLPMDYVTCRLVGRGSVQYPLEGKPCLTIYQVLGHTRSARHNWVTTVKLHPHTGEHPDLEHTAADLSSAYKPSGTPSMIVSAGRIVRESMPDCKKFIRVPETSGLFPLTTWSSV